MGDFVRFEVHPSWQIVFDIAGVPAEEVLKRASLPLDLFQRNNAGLNTQEYFRLWRALELTINDGTFPITLGEKLEFDSFDPAIFCAFCSPNFNTALGRIARFKPLLGPVALDLDVTEETTTLSLRFLDPQKSTPSSLLAMELVFFIQLIRRASKCHVVPLAVFCPNELACAEAYERFAGVAIQRDDVLRLVFSAEDATRSFVSADAGMWEFFEPRLRKRLDEVQISPTLIESARTVIVEMLASGETTIDQLARRMLMSRRTLQRRLGEQGTSFSQLLHGVREELAKHYIVKSELPYAQIALLLGYENPNSFFRAFNSWTGNTPDNLRSSTLES